MTTKKKKPTQAQRADRHDLYERAVQDVESEIDFVVQTWGELRKRPLRKLREDFSGTCATSCEFVRRGRTHEAWCVDHDPAVLEWAASTACRSSRRRAAAACTRCRAT